MLTKISKKQRRLPPLGGGFGKLFKIGSQPLTAQVSAYKNVVTPDDYGADWQVRAMVMWMFPRK